MGYSHQSTKLCLVPLLVVAHHDASELSVALSVPIQKIGRYTVNKQGQSLWNRDDDGYCTRWHLRSRVDKDDNNSELPYNGPLFQHLHLRALA